MGKRFSVSSPNNLYLSVRGLGGLCRPPGPFFLGEVNILILTRYRRYPAMFCAVLLLFFSLYLQPKSAQANAGALLGGIEIGALAFWGGAALVGVVGTAVGLDPVVMGQVEAFGKDVWVSANDQVKQSITFSIGAMSEGWNTTTRYPVAWSTEAYNYITAKWNQWFGGGVIVDSSGKIIQVATLDALIVPSTLYAKYPLYASGNADLGAEKTGSSHVLSYVSVDAYGAATLTWSDGTFAGQRSFKNLISGEPFKNAIQAYKFAVGYWGLVTTLQTVPGTLVSGSTQYQPLVYKDSALPRSMSLPAPRGALNPDGSVAGYDKPTIGRVGGVPAGGIAVGFPANVGDFTGLKAGDAVTATPTDTTNPSTPPIDTNPPKDSDKIDWTPLILAGVKFTEKFPFSIPWDVKRQLNVFNVSPQAPVFVVNVPNFIRLGDSIIPLYFEVNLSQFNLIATIIRWLTTIAFDLAVILAMRRFMPE